MTTFTVHPIGSIQEGENGFTILVNPPYRPALQGLEGFGHLNILWWFSELDTPENRQVLQAPQPYKNAPETMGIFATRSPIRPNPLALTTVQVLHLDPHAGTILVPFIDANQGTPVLDIKPYTPSFDRIETPIVPSWCQNWPQSVEESGSFPWESVFNF